MNKKNKNKREDIDDRVSERYEILEKIGKGVFGVVYKGLDKNTNSIVAIKKTFDVYSSTAESERLLRELILISHFKEHPNIVKVYNVINSQSGKDLYIIYEYFPANLFSVIRANILTTNHIKFIIYQLLKILKYVHSAGIIHRNLKPSNILITPESKIKLDDFSLAKSILSKDDDFHSNITDYIAIRWYRPPEVLLGAEYFNSMDDKGKSEKIPLGEDSNNNLMNDVQEKKYEIGYDTPTETIENVHEDSKSQEEKTQKSAEYSKKGDLWSVGCIMGEMLCGKTIFPGSSTLNQLNLIVKLVGFPTEEDMNQIKVSLTGLLESIKLLQKIESCSGFDLDLNLDKSNKNNISDMAPKTNIQCGYKKLFPGIDENALDLLKKFLTFNPHKRISVDEALDHPFLKDCRNPDEELVCSNKIDLNFSEEFKNNVIIFRNRYQIEENLYSSVNTCFNTKVQFKTTKDEIICENSTEETKKKN